MYGHSVACFLCIVWCSLSTVTGSLEASSAFEITENSWSTAVPVLIVSIVVTVCGVVVVLACANCCPKKEHTFQDFTNEEYFRDVRIEPPNTDFVMLPPMIDTVDTRGCDNPIVFEPLPDVGALRKQLQKTAVTTGPALKKSSNLTQLQPKIVQIGHERMENEDEIECLSGDTTAAAQERVQLEKLISNMRYKLTRGQLQYVREMGEGWFGKVILAEGQDLLPGHKKTRVVIQSMQEAADQRSQFIFLQEAAVFREMEHANVLKMFGQCVETAPFLTVLELCSLGDVKMYLRSRRTDHDAVDKQGLLLNMACDMASGLQALHQCNFIHRDFAIRNCLITSDMTVKVGDYGLSEHMYKDDYYVDSDGTFIPIRWLAPEVMIVLNGSIELRQITKDSNLWSFGVALWELVTFGAMPYNELNNETFIKQVIVDGAHRLSQPEVPVSNLDKLFQLMTLCWLAPAQRPSLRELRIMLLHLRSSRDELDTAVLADFDRKWNQLMPRKNDSSAVPASMSAMSLSIRSDSDDEELGTIDFALDAKSPSSLGLRSGDMRMNMLGPVHGPGSFGLNTFTVPGRPASFDSEFSTELNASLLAQAGSLQESLGSFSTSPANTPDEGSSIRLPHLSFPTNELSLAAEFGLANDPDLQYDFEVFTLTKNSGGKILQDSQQSVVADVHTISYSDSTVSEEMDQNNIATSVGQVDVNSTASVDVIDSDAVILPEVSDERTSKKSQANGSLSEYESEQVSPNKSMNSREENLETVEKNGVLSKEAIAESFIMVGSQLNVDTSPVKSSSLDLGSPTKSTNSSGDWCMVSNTASEHSKEADFDRLSRLTDHSSLTDAAPSTVDPDVAKNNSSQNFS